MPRLTVNGSPRDVRAGLTVADLLEELGIPEKTLIVELNRDVLAPGDYARTELAEADVLELIRFVGGG